MASLRGGESLWAAAAVSNNGGLTDTSNPGYIGPGAYVALFINNGGATSLTVKVQVNGSANPSAGLNNIPNNWADYQKVAGTTLSFTVAAGVEICFDLSPFAPQMIRLVRTDSTGALTGVTAFITSDGPN